MKKEKQESPLKAARKKTREAIEIRLIKILKTIAGELGQGVIDFEKEAKKLAKKITKKLKVKKESADKETPSTNGTVKPVKESSDTKEKAVSKPAVSKVKKTVAKATPSKTVTAKPDAIKTAAPKPAKK